MRPHQWVKNAFVMAPVVFSLNVDQPDMLLKAAAATLLFCLISGAVYLLNDIVDLEADRAYPVKRHRAIPSGVVPIVFARMFCAVLVVGSVSAMLLIDRWAAAVALLYFIVNVAYSLKLKHSAFVDVSVIATGFLLRVLAGSLAIGVDVSVWLVLCTFLLALFLALGKRRHELLSAKKGTKQRAVLGRYNPAHVHFAMILVGGLTVGAYTAYTLSPMTQVAFGFSWPRLALTVPFTAFGVLRFFTIANQREELASPTEQMLKDPLFLLNLAGWIFAVLVLVYLL